MTEQQDQGTDGGAHLAAADPRQEIEQMAAVNAPTGEGTIEQLQGELAASEERYLRLRADTENYKKRLERTASERIESARKDLLRRLLGVKDNLERALQYGETAQNGEGIMEGVRLTQYQLDQLLQAEGVKAIDAVNQPFDPRIEEAIQSVNDPRVPDNTVVQVVRQGYTYKDDVLRPAQVIVSVHADSSTT